MQGKSFFTWVSLPGISLYTTHWPCRRLSRRKSGGWALKRNCFHAMKCTASIQATSDTGSFRAFTDPHCKFFLFSIQFMGALLLKKRAPCGFSGHFERLSDHLLPNSWIIWVSETCAQHKLFLICRLKQPILQLLVTWRPSFRLINLTLAVVLHIDILD